MLAGSRSHAIYRRIKSQTAIITQYYSDVDGGGAKKKKQKQNKKKKKRKKNSGCRLPDALFCGFQVSAYRSVQLPKCV